MLSIMTATLCAELGSNLESYFAITFCVSLFFFHLEQFITSTFLKSTGNFFHVPQFWFFLMRSSNYLFLARMLLPWRDVLLSISYQGYLMSVGNILCHVYLYQLEHRLWETQIKNIERNDLRMFRWRKATHLPETIPTSEGVFITAA